MFIWELEEDTEINLHCSINDNETIVSTKVLLSLEKHRCILIAPLKYRGKWLGFDNISTSLEIITMDGKVLLFNDLAIKPMIYKNVQYHCIASDEDVSPSNRRSAKRVRFGIQGILHIGEIGKKCPCIIHDISYTGAGVYIEQEIKIKPNMPGAISFSYGDNNQKYRISGEIVRQKHIEEIQKFNVGLKFQKESPELGKLITEIQRMEASKFRGTKEYNKNT